MKIQRQHRHNMIAIHDASLFANEDGAIGVPVQRHSEMSPLLSDRLLQQLGMDRATAGIDIHPVRLIADYFTSNCLLKACYEISGKTIGIGRQWFV